MGWKTSEVELGKTTALSSKLGMLSRGLDLENSTNPNYSPKHHFKIVFTYKFGKSSSHKFWDSQLSRDKYNSKLHHKILNYTIISRKSKGNLQFLRYGNGFLN